MRSSYIWLPLSVSGTTLSLPNNYLNWVVDVNSGSMTAGPSENWYEAENASSIAASLKAERKEEAVSNTSNDMAPTEQMGAISPQIPPSQSNAESPHILTYLERRTLRPSARRLG